MHIAIPKSTLNYIEKTRNKGGLKLEDNFNDLDQLLQTKGLLVNSLLTAIESEKINLDLKEEDFFNVGEGATGGKIKTKFEKCLEPLQTKLAEVKEKLEVFEKEHAEVSKSKLLSSKKKREKRMGDLEASKNLWRKEEEKIEEKIAEIKKLEEDVLYFEKAYWMNLEELTRQAQILEVETKPKEGVLSVI